MTDGSEEQPKKLYKNIKPKMNDKLNREHSFSIMLFKIIFLYNFSNNNR